MKRRPCCPSVRGGALASVQEEGIEDEFVRGLALLIEILESVPGDDDNITPTLQRAGSRIRSTDHDARYMKTRETGYFGYKAHTAMSPRAGSSPIPRHTDGRWRYHHGTRRSSMGCSHMDLPPTKPLVIHITDQANSALLQNVVGLRSQRRYSQKPSWLPGSSKDSYTIL